MTILVTAHGWRVTFPADPANVAIILVTQCGAPHFYFAFDRAPITEEGQTSITMRQQPTPRGAVCSVDADLVQAEDDDPAHERIVDSASASEVK